MKSKPMTEAETRLFLLERFRLHGLEDVLLKTFSRIDEALAHAKTQEEKDLIALEGLAEIDKLCGAKNSNLAGTSISGVSQEAIDIFNKKQE